MDTTSLYYFSELAKDLHMTRTAERLYISQQTLSNHIQRLENYYDVPLLYRKPKLSLTYAGEYVLKFAQNVTREHQNLKDILSDIKKEECGLLRFGASPLRLNAWLPNILPAFSLNYPDIEIRITDTTSQYLEPKILNGDLDLAVILSGSENPNIISEHLMSDQVYLCVSDRLLFEHYGDEAEHLKQISCEKADLKNFEKLPFCMLSNQLGQIIQQQFIEENINPKIYTYCSSVQISTAIGLKGVAGCFATRTSLLNQHKSFPRDMNVFPIFIHDKPFMHQLYFIYHKERYLSSYCKEFMRLLSDYCSRTEHISLDEL